MRLGLSALAILITMCANASGQTRLIVLDPGHFHASLLRVALFNTRKTHPTSWKIELHASPDFFERMIQEHPGNVVVIAGRNRPKIDRIEASINAGLNVLCDKPWIISSSDMPGLDRTLDLKEEQSRRLRHHDGAIRDYLHSPKRTGR